MGCGASRNDVIPSPKSSLEPKSSEKTKSSVSENGSNSHNTESLNSTSSVRSESSTIPASDYYQNNLNLDSDRLKPLEKSLLQPPLKPPRSTKVDPQEKNNMEQVSRLGPIAFEVPADDQRESESLIKRHPPRRLRKTMEEQSNELAPSLTQESLKEKVELANERRNQALYQRVASARQKSARVAHRVRDMPSLESGSVANEFRND